MKIPTIAEIETYIQNAGSDDLPTFGGTFQGGIHCQQVPDEIAPCIHAILKSKQPVLSYLEIGVAAGGTAYLFNHFFQPESIVLIDDNKHHKAGLRAEILEGITYREIINHSHSEEAISKGAQWGPYDVIFIDGDHTYPAVKLDTILYPPNLKPGGFLILHDSALTQWGVPRVVRELKEDTGMEFINEWVSAGPAKCGVALFRKVK